MSIKIFFVSVFLIFLEISPLFADFSNSGNSITGLDYSIGSWADYDSDGDFDFIISGSGSEKKMMLYKNDGSGSFSVEQNFITAYYMGGISWADFDKDGDMDFAITGQDSNDDAATEIYQNDNGTFEKSDIKLDGYYFSSVAWGDYNNDGNLDLAVAGFTGSYYKTKLYKNNGDSSFSDSGFSFTGAAHGNVTLADYNNDGFVDLTIIGSYTDDESNPFDVFKIYDNDKGSSFSVSDSSAVALDESWVSWGDYDNDGNLDFALSGIDSSKSTRICRIYHNEGASNYKFKSTAALQGIDVSRQAWGDYDNDGDLDLIVCGFDGTQAMTKIYDNDSNNFSAASHSFTGVLRGDVNWADCDGDRDLDILEIGATLIDGSPAAKIYINDQSDTKANNIPPKAQEFYSRYYNDKLYIMWNDPPDTDETSLNGLYYNFRVGTSSGTSNLVPSRYGSPLLGNYFTKATSWTIVDTDIDSDDVDVGGYKNVRILNVSGANYYWAVQTIDTSLGYSWASSYGDGWSEQQVFIDTTGPTGLPSVPLDEGEATYDRDLSFTWTKGTANDPQTGIYACYVEIKEVDQTGAENIVVSEELNKNIASYGVWDRDGNALYEYKGKLYHTYYIRIKARHGYGQNLPTTTYRPDLYATSSDPDGLWHPNSPHYTSWTDWSNGIEIVELLTINNNLMRNPGPGGDAVEISYSLTKDSHVTIRIFNILGELVKTVLDEDVAKGSEQIAKWYGLTNNDEIVSSGVYYVNIQAGGNEDTDKVVVIK